MRLLGFGCALILLGASLPAVGQVPAAPAPAQEPPPPEPPAPGPPPPEPAPQEAPSQPDSPAQATPEPPPPVATPEPPPAPAKVEQNDVVIEAQDQKKDEPKPAPFARARSPITLEGRLGFSWRPEGDAGFDDARTRWAVSSGRPSTSS
jgi:hypothetical protein